jgi:hypothetical protein
VIATDMIAGSNLDVLRVVPASACQRSSSSYSLRTSIRTMLPLTMFDVGDLSDAGGSLLDLQDTIFSSRLVLLYSSVQEEVG